MSNEAQNLIEGLLEKARDIARSETVVGEPIKFNDVLVVPVVQISIGFGAGGGSGSEGSKNGGVGAGGGGGIRIEPSCFLVHDGTTVRLLPAKGGKGKGMDSLIEKLPDLLTYAMDSLRGHGERRPEDETSEGSEE
ncbi:sporulation protein [bacterium]|nr:sporulation protein [bacterium]